jgi:hypothetical protein
LIWWRTRLAAGVVLNLSQIFLHRLYGRSGKLRVQAEGAATAANQERLYNASTVVEWLKAETQGQKKLSDLFERRFLPEFRPGFELGRRLTRSTIPMLLQAPS